MAPVLVVGSERIESNNSIRLVSRDPVQTPISLDKGHIVSYISAKCETKQMYVFI